MSQNRVTNDDMAQRVETSDEWIRTDRIQARHFADSAQASSDLACEAARRALDAAETAVESIDLLIVATMTPDMPFLDSLPGTEQIRSWENLCL